ncbi:MAG: hypothetical protein LBC68_00780 [Prevotellaceae bacterium]|jgi:hypothetical protein|nr:hypothetical protein [Prevotellaceae bacterium]
MRFLLLFLSLFLQVSASGDDINIFAAGESSLSLANGGWQTQYQRDFFGLEAGRTFSGGVRSRIERDSLGRVTGQKIEKNNRYINLKNRKDKR